MITRILAGIALVSASLAGLAATAHADTIRVMAAASLQPALTALAEQIERETPHQIVPIYASSGTLARQISQGAPADLFLSANTRWADWALEDLALPSEAASDLLENRLVVVAAIDRAKARLSDFPSNGLLALGDPAHVPAGQYTKESLSALGHWDRLRKNMVFTANVRVALTFAERGEVDGAIVYRSDARSSSRVTVVEDLPATSHPPIRYRMIRLSSKGDILAELLHSKAYGKIFEEFGFVLVPEP